MTVKDLVLPWDTTSVSLTRVPDDSILESLQALAFADADVASRAESLFMFLRKVSGRSVANEYLMGIQHLAVQGDPAGSRLLAAFVDVSTPGDRLLPRVQRFSSSRRLKLRLSGDDSGPGNIHREWLDRLEDLTAKCAVLARETGALPDTAPPVPGLEQAWVHLRDGLELLLARLALGDDFEAADRKLLVELLRLEVDAWQERISHLAGSIDPFRTEAITRVLPILSIADAEIRDLRHMITWIEEGCQGTEFDKPLSRSLDVLEDNDRAALRKVLAADTGLFPLAGLFEGLAEHPVRVPVMAHCVERMQALAGRLALVGVPDVDLDVVTAAQLVQSHFSTDGDESEFQLPLPPGFPETCERILQLAEDGMGKETSELWGLKVRGDVLVIGIPEGGSFLEHDLPAVTVDHRDDAAADEIMAWAGEMQDAAEHTDSEDEQIDPDSATATELKNLVMTNIQSISVLLGFLRNPKIVAIPGLVEEVVNRSRNPVVIETVSKVRILHTGFANRGVPLACLRSPVNVPINTLRKFMHVKYVSKVDLKRLALDKSGIRKEVGREVKKYLQALT